MFRQISTITDLTRYPSPAVLIRDDEAGAWVIADVCIEQAKRLYPGTVSDIYIVDLNQKRLNGLRTQPE